MVFGSLRHRMASPLTGGFVAVLLAFCAIALAVLLLVFSAGCGGGGDDDNTIVTPTPTPSVGPSPTPSPIISPLPSPSPSPSPNTPPVTGETLTVGQAVIGITNVTADAGISSSPIVYFNSGFAIGATNNTLGASGSSAQVFFSDVKDGLLRSVTLVTANDKSTVKEGDTFTLGPAVSKVSDKSAFVLYTTKPSTDTDDSRLKQWHSAGGGTVVVEKLSDGQAKLRIIDAQMQPRTDVANNGQAGSFTLNGAGFAQITSTK